MARSKKNVVKFRRPEIPKFPLPTYSEQLAELQGVCVNLLASAAPLSMSTTHVDDHWLDELRHVLIRQGVEIKSKVK